MKKGATGPFAISPLTLQKFELRSIPFFKPRDDTCRCREAQFRTSYLA